MLNIEEILKMSEEMGIDISDGNDGKHYIIDDSGKEVEFNTNMIISKTKEKVSYKLELEGYNGKKIDTSNESYNLKTVKNAYEPITVRVKDYITEAA